MFQIKFLSMLSFDIFTAIHLQKIFIKHDLNILMIFGIKETTDTFDP